MVVNHFHRLSRSVIQQVGKHQFGQYDQQERLEAFEYENYTNDAERRKIQSQGIPRVGSSDKTRIHPAKNNIKSKGKHKAAHKEIRFFLPFEQIDQKVTAAQKNRCYTDVYPVGIVKFGIVLGACQALGEYCIQYAQNDV